MLHIDPEYYKLKRRLTLLIEYSKFTYSRKSTNDIKKTERVDKIIRQCLILIKHLLQYFTSADSSNEIGAAIARNLVQNDFKKLLIKLLKLTG